eukprot:4174537-Pyramimonas_sp.AAC.1
MCFPRNETLAGSLAVVGVGVVAPVGDVGKIAWGLHAAQGMEDGTNEGCEQSANVLYIALCACT